MAEILHAARHVTEIFGLLSFVASLAFFSFLAYLKYRQSVVESLDVDGKLSYLSDWLKLDTGKLSDKQVFQLARDTINAKHRRFVAGCRYSLATLLASCLLVLILTTVDRGSGLGAECNEALRRADSRLAHSDASTALDFYSQAKNSCGPKDWRPINGQGAAYFGLSDYGAALNRFEEASRVASPGLVSAFDLATLRNSQGYALEGLGRYQEALDQYIIAAQQFDPNSNSYKDTVFSQGRMHLAIWLDTSDIARRNQAAARFTEFLKLGQMPKTWAYYNLACLEAASPERSGDASRLLSSAIDAAIQTSSDKAQIHRHLLRRLVLDNSAVERRPTLPLPCKSLQNLVASSAELQEKFAKLN